MGHRDENRLNVFRILLGFWFFHPKPRMSIEFIMLVLFVDAAES